MGMEGEMKEDEIEQLIDYRLKHFAVEINEVCGGSFIKEEKSLSVTHNGNTWASIALTKQEAEQVIKALQKWLRREK